MIIKNYVPVIALAAMISSPAYACPPPITHPDSVVPEYKPVSQRGSESRADFLMRETAAKQAYQKRVDSFLDYHRGAKARIRSSQLRSQKYQAVYQGKAMAKATHILLVTPTTLSLNIDERRLQSFNTKFKVKRVLKGEFSKENVSFSGSREWMCGYVSRFNLASIELDQRYIILSKGEKFRVVDLTGVYRLSDMHSLSLRKQLEELGAFEP